MILEEETFEKFGYYPSDLKSHSSKRLLAACDSCGMVRETTKDAYRSLCHRCSMRRLGHLRVGTKHSENAKAKMRENHADMRGEKSPLFGKPLSIETKVKISKANKGRRHSEEEKAKRRETHVTLKGAENPYWKPRVKCICQECGVGFEVPSLRFEKGKVKFCSKKCKGIWQSKTKKGEYGQNWKGGQIKRECEKCGKTFIALRSKIRRGGGKFCSVACYKSFPRKRKPTKPELIFEAICKKYNLPFHYVGNRKILIGKNGEKQLNPDFIETNGKKILVEVMGQYWHSPLLNRKLREDATLDYRKSHFKRYKWHPIFLWETDLLRKDAEAFVLNQLKKERVI